MGKDYKIGKNDLEQEPETPEAEVEPTPEPEVVHRPRIGASIMGKLDEILAAVKTDEGSQNPDGVEEVTFQPEESQLPTMPGDEEPEDPEASANGEGTANVAKPIRPEFRHPSSRPKELVR